MATVMWKPAINALTNPRSYRIQYVPRNVVGYDEMARDIAATHPNYNEDLVRSLAPLLIRWIQERLINGDQVTLEDAFTFLLSFSGKLDSPDDPLPEDDDFIQVGAYASRPFAKEVRHATQLERLPMSEKQPLINSTKDTCLKLNDVLYGQGLLKLIGSNLMFNAESSEDECVIEGTHNGRLVQERFGKISNREILLAPNIPSQENPWNNEYIVSLTTHYTTNGTARTGTYSRRLRTILTISAFGQDGSEEVGILTDNANSPYVSVIGGSASNDQRLRIQVRTDSSTNKLNFNLIDMQEHGAAGPILHVTENGEYTLEGYTGSFISSMVIRVDNFTALKTMVRTNYRDRLVDILDIEL